MKRFALYFFFDKDGIVDDYNIFLLNDLKKNVDYLLVVCNGTITGEGRNKFESVATEVIERENKGFDVWAYKEGIEKTGWDVLEDYDEVVLLNFTNFGPVHPFAEMFSEMDKKELDFWGITEHYGHNYDPYHKCKYGYIPRHIQSSFIAVRQQMVKSAAFHEYWEHMPMVHDYAEAICLHEAVFTEDFSRKGFQSEVYVKTEDLRDYTDYPLMLYPVELIKNRKCPIFKRKTFFNLYEEFLDINCGQPAIELYEYLKNETQFNMDMIWDNLLRTANMYDLKQRMQLNYILPQDFQKKKRVSSKRIALFMHIFEMDQITFCKKYANAMPDDAAILITTDTEAKKKELIQAFNDFECDVRIFLVRNRGRDVSALFIGLKPYVADFDYICFVHDKKSHYDYPYMIGESFAYHCFENVLGSKAYVENIINLFEENPRLGLAVPPPPCHGSYYSTIGREWQGNFSNVKKYAEQWGIHVNIDDTAPPVAPLGSTFWFRSDALKSLFQIQFQYEDFPEEPIRERDGNIMHSIERIYPFAAQATGYYSAWIMTDKYAKLEITNLYKMLRDINESLFWTFGIDERKMLLHHIWESKNTVVELKQNLEDTKKELEEYKCPKTIGRKLKMITKCILGHNIYSRLWEIHLKLGNHQ